MDASLPAMANSNFDGSWQTVRIRSIPENPGAASVPCHAGEVYGAGRQHIKFVFHPSFSARWSEDV